MIYDGQGSNYRRDNGEESLCDKRPAAPESGESQSHVGSSTRDDQGGPFRRVERRRRRDGRRERLAAYRLPSLSAACHLALSAARVNTTFTTTTKKRKRRTQPNQKSDLYMDECDVFLLFLGKAVSERGRKKRQRMKKHATQNSARRDDLRDSVTFTTLSKKKISPHSPYFNL